MLVLVAFSFGDFRYSAGIRAKDISLQGVTHELATPRPTYQPSILKLLDMVRHRCLPDIVLATELSAWHWRTELADVSKDSDAPRLGQRLRDQLHLPFR
jgi:hypothetical protein